MQFYLDYMESMRVNKSTGECTINYPKGSWNLALQAEGYTDKGKYPSIFGTHNGTIKPLQTITVS